MALRSIQQLKSWFKKGMYPTESQFGDWLDSFFHREDKIPVGSVDGLAEAINSKAEKTTVETLSNNVSVVSQQASAADQKAQQAIQEASAVIATLRDGVPVEGDTLAKLYTLIQTINSLLRSDDVTLDTVQEIVAFIKNNKNVIDTISTNKINISDIVDNLLSTATDKPLSANQGKVLKDLIASPFNYMVQPIVPTNENITVVESAMVYKLDIASAKTITISIDPSVKPLIYGKIITFEVHIKFINVSAIVFPTNLTWLNSSPIMNEVGKTYAITIRTHDAGEQYIGNLAYTY